MLWSKAIGVHRMGKNTEVFVLNFSKSIFFWICNPKWHDLLFYFIKFLYKKVLKSVTKQERLMRLHYAKAYTESIQNTLGKLHKNEILANNFSVSTEHYAENKNIFMETSLLVCIISIYSCFLLVLLMPLFPPEVWWKSRPAWRPRVHWIRLRDTVLRWDRKLHCWFLASL